MNTRITELDKLENYLKENDIEYERIDTEMPPDILMGSPVIIPRGFGERHQICVPHTGSDCDWDVICNYGSYGFEDGLLELMGTLVTEEEYEYDSVVGYLTAEDIIERLETKMNNERKGGKDDE